jgi:hypothetical protein
MLEHSTTNGYVASVAVNLGSYFTLKSEYVLTHVEPYREYDYPSGEYVFRPPVDERAWYNGIAFRNGAGWLVTGLGAATMLAFVIVFLSSFDGFAS